MRKEILLCIGACFITLSPAIYISNHFPNMVMPWLPPFILGAIYADALRRINKNILLKLESTDE